tara:strand:+ start:387 stop:1199 length:813 start_codon:yes stop_codon:yes gene_type:complete
MISSLRRVGRKYLLRPSYEASGALQVLCTVLFFWALLQGFPLWAWGAAFVVYFMFYCVGMSVGYHRYYAHHQFKARPWAQWLMLVCAVLGGQSSPGAWAHQHILHHRGTDTEADPHFFGRHGFKMLLIWFYPRYEFTGWPTRRYLRDPKILFVHKYHNLFLLAWLVALFAIAGFPGVLFGWCIPFAWTTAASLSLVTFAHYGGPGSYRNHDLADESHNVLWLGHLTFGEAWHNNHHRHAGKTHFGQRWWEFDAGHYVIRLLRSEKGHRAP